MRRIAARILLGLSLAAFAPGMALAVDSAAGAALFENRIRPVLVESCYGCHSSQAETVEGELSLESRASVARGGRSGPVVVPGDPSASRLLRALAYDDPTLQMPPDGKLPEEVVNDFRHWIELGAPDPRDGSAEVVETIASRAQAHWAFAPPHRPQLPGDDGSAWSVRPLDQLILAELTVAGFKPARSASRGELLRRVYFDLIGLPPTWQQVEAFASDASPDAYLAVVDSLLASPQFGERWARHWLDVARFADTKGYVFTEKRDFPHAYKYRDWVIAAFNDNMPIDQFMKYQIAADHMIEADPMIGADPSIGADTSIATDEVAATDQATAADPTIATNQPPAPEQPIEHNSQRHHLAALGYITLGRRFINNPHDIIADRIDVIFRGMMGMTASCARCHDHKFDPISDEDYYALYGIFASSSEVQDDDLPLRLSDKQEPQDVGVFVRGNARNRGAAVKRGFPEFFHAIASPVEAGSGRMELARAIADDQNPLTARVFVNRVWGHLFGEPLVATTSDFGLRSEVPRQQAVLDLLATDFVSHDWSLKWLVRELVTSSTYCQSSQAELALVAADPENRLWGRMNRRRRDFESLRDGLLAVSGLLEGRVGGESERIDTLEGSRRRTLYAYIDRQNLPGLFRAFDFASPDTHSPRRPHTIVPQQALFLLNSPIVQQVASALVASLTEELTDAHSDERTVELTDEHTDEHTEQRIIALYRRVLARDPSAVETELAHKFLAARTPQPLPTDPWSFGYGKIESLGERATVNLEPLSHFVDNRWQAGSDYPDPTLGHLAVSSAGGHPGDRIDCCSIRRWTAPEAGRLSISGALQRPSDKGDGIEAFLVSSRRGLLAHWTVPQGKQSTPVELPTVMADESLDFVVSCRDNPGWDSFDWNLDLALETNSGWKHWSSRRDFHGPPAKPLDLWSQLAQVLLVSSDFLFID